MSLVPYSSGDSREIVLRHEDALVVRDPQSNQLVLRAASSHLRPPEKKLSECPLCHQTIRSQSPERDGRTSNRRDSFVSPEYFRMLHSTLDDSDDDQNPPSSPIRRLVQPSFPFPAPTVSEEVEGDFITSEPTNVEGQGIKRDAFSPNYYRKFFTEEKELGRGGKGVVYLVRHELDGVSLGHFACKRVPVGDDHAWLEKVLIEVQLLQRLSHPNLVSYRHVWLEDFQPNRFGPSLPCAFILQQYCNSGDLLHYVIGNDSPVMSPKEKLKDQLRRRSMAPAERPNIKSSQRRLTFDEIYSVFKDITSGLVHLHASKYIHRDLKPSNCLLHKTDNDIKCLISDFGEVQAAAQLRKSTGATGTVAYCAPEVLRRDDTGHYGEFTTKSDIFSLGMILYFLCFGRLPYSSADAVQEELEDLDLLRAEISTWSGFRDERKARPDLPEQLYEFLKRLLSIDPVERPSANEILQAILSGSGLDKPPRAGRTSSLNNIRLGGRVIHSLSTPDRTPLREKSTSHTYVEHLNEEGNAALTSGGDTEDDKHLSQDSKHLGEELVQGVDRSMSPPQHLLLAPPSTRLQNIKLELAVYCYHVASWVSHDPQMAIMIAKLTLFGTKIYFLTQPCLPAATKPSFAYPLLILAAVDLGLGRKLPWQSMVLSALVHYMVIIASLRMQVLCLPRHTIWE